MTKQEEYLTNLITSTNSYVRDLKNIQNSAHFHQIRLPEIPTRFRPTVELESTAVSVLQRETITPMINNHLQKVIDELVVNIETYEIMLDDRLAFPQDHEV